jgi:hypothetical protein
LNLLKKQIAGLPIGVWLLIIVAGIVVGILLRKKSQAAGLEEDSTGAEGDSQYADTVPYESLPSEDTGYFPISGGGAPVVPGATQAVRISPKVIRVRVVYPHHKKKKHHN